MAVFNYSKNVLFLEVRGIVDVGNRTPSDYILKLFIIFEFIQYFSVNVLIIFIIILIILNLIILKLLPFKNSFHQQINIFGLWWESNPHTVKNYSFPHCFNL